MTQRDPSSERPEEGTDTLNANASAALDGADVLFDARPVPQKVGPGRKVEDSKPENTEPPIGTALMLPDESIVLKLKAHGTGVEGEGVLTYRPGEKNYQNILRHLSGLSRGQTKLVMPFNESSTTGGQPDAGDKNVIPKGGEDLPDIPIPEAKPEAAPDVVTPPSKNFTDKVNDTYNGMSKEVRDLIDSSGAKLVPTRKITDAMPELKGQKPRGWPPGSTWDAVDGAYSPSKKLIIVAEEVEDQNGQWRKSNRTTDVTRHEVGHAVDAALNYYSAHPDFGKVYQSDKAAVPTIDQKTLEYFLQPGTIGAEETFAEGIADLEGGATGGATFSRNFKATIDHIKQRLKASQPAIITPPAVTAPVTPGKI